MARPVIGGSRPRGWQLAIGVVFIALSSCGDADNGRRTPVKQGQDASTARPAPTRSPAPFYLAVLARPSDVYPQAMVSGTFQVRNGCAMLDDDLLVLVAGTSLVGTGSEPMVRIAGYAPQRLAPGYRIVGGGGYYPIDRLGRTDTGLELVEPAPARCAAVASQAVLAVPERIAPPSRYADKLYAAVQRENLSPPTLAPVGGTLGVVDQCLVLGKQLVVLPAGSSVEFDGDGSLTARIAGSRYMETVIARPGDRISGSGAGLSAEAGELPAMPRPLLQSIPPRCRKVGRGGVLLNPGPTVTRADTTPYADPGATMMTIVPPPAPPRPIDDARDCPAGSRPSHGYCRKPDGTLVPPRDRTAG